MSTATLTWVDPNARTDGTTLDPSEILSIDVFDSFAGAPPITIANLAGAATSFTTGTLSVGMHTFTVIVNDTNGHSSTPSNSASVTAVAVLAPPAAVTTLSATLNP